MTRDPSSPNTVLIVLDGLVAVMRDVGATHISVDALEREIANIRARAHDTR